MTRRALASLAAQASLAALALLTLAPRTDLAAQVARGTVTDSASGGPLAGAVVSLQVGDSGDPFRRARVDVSGRYELAAPRPGAYVVTARAIGFARQQRTVMLNAGETVRTDFQLARNVVRVAAVRVAERSDCTAPDALAAGGAALWSDVWTALSATQLSEAAVSAAGIMRFRRELAPGSGLLRTESRQVQRGGQVAPFVAATAATLAREGFVRETDDGGLELFAPDAATVMASDFIRQHCFAITTSDSTASAPHLGLRFWPRRDFTARGIAGVFWLDAASRELRDITFGYPRLTAVGTASDSLGGSVRFAHASDGTWYVSQWRLRVPVMLQSGRTTDWRGRPMAGETHDSLVAVSEEGGVVFEDSSGTPLARLLGEVIAADGRAIPSAEVSLLGTSLRTRTDANGAFAIAPVIPGRYRLRVTSPGTDTATAAFHQVEVRVAELPGAPLRLAIPDARTQGAAVCAARRGRDAESLSLVGLVVEGGRAAALRALEARWMEYSTEGANGVLRGRTLVADFTTDSLGVFRICAVPPRASVSFRRAGAGGDDWSWPVTLGATLSVLQLTADSAGRIAAVAGAAPASVTMAQQQVERAAAVRLTGTVRLGDSSAVPLAEVELQLDADSSTTVRTTAEGSFVLDGVARGVHVITARRLGFAPRRTVVVVGSAAPPPLDIRLTRAAQRLSAVVVEGQSEAMEIAGGAFAARRTAGFGVFLGPEEMNARRGQGSLTNVIVAKVPGLEVVPLYRGTMSAGYGIATRRFRSLGKGQMQPCFAQVFIDGSRASGMQGEAFDFEQLGTLDIAAIEVYRGASETPNEFNGPSAACGTVVIWTRRR
ncbi:MAG: carboxypeptidase regulatory-like domain-containing protein [Gemmatimonadaceae bacterium]|nr:carboxypeptidase regulatory-like domain-containing protein [Gemmatimonadaceae bacterium]